MILKNTEKKEKSIVELTIQVETQEFRNALSAAYLKRRGSITVPGFRKGKAPRNIIERMYGESFFWEDAVNSSYPAAYEAALREAGIEAVGRADMDVSDISAEGYTFVAQVPVAPEVTLADYKGIEAVRMAATVDDSAADAELDRMRRRNARIETVERAAQNGDTAVIDYEGFCDGVAFDGGKGEMYSLELGSGSFIPGFEEQIVGRAAGDELDVNVTFPEQYHAEALAGKPAVFKVKVHEIKETLLPDLDDEFAKDVSEFDTLDELKADILGKQRESREAETKNMFENSVLEQLGDRVTADIPDAMIDAEAENMLENMSYRMQQQGLDMETYMKLTGMDAAAMLAEQRPQAEKRVRITLALEKIAADEGFTVTDEEIDAEYSKLAEQYNMPVDRVKMAMNETLLRGDLLRSKASELVVAAAVAVDPAEEKTEEPAEKPKKASKPRKKKAAEPEEKAAEGVEDSAEAE